MGLVRNLYEKVELRISKEGEQPGAAAQQQKPNFLREWRVERATRTLRRRYGTAGLYVRVLYALLFVLGVIAFVVLEATGHLGLIAWAREGIGQAVAVASSVIGVLAAAVPATKFGLRTHRESDVSYGDRVFNEARSIKDSVRAWHARAREPARAHQERRSARVRHPL